MTEADASLLDSRVAASLQQHGVVFQVLACDPDLADTAAFCEHYGYGLEQSANTILVAAKSDLNQLVACVLLATTKLDVNKKVCQLMGVKRASFASAEQTVAVSRMQVGGVTAFGLPESIPVYVDSRVVEQPEVVMGGGNRSSKLVLSAQELQKLPQVEIIENLALPKE